ncbi:MAG: tripartite tricarboxylate transporter substrate binding protein [Betaproteobacteria bacterium]|jgi:tripartite-type tricarboxylate transporter receptor subunit TctC
MTLSVPLNLPTSRFNTCSWNWALALFLSAVFVSSFAQDIPTNKPITMIVGFAAGGASDTAARLIAKKLSENLGQTVLIDNKAGAGGNIAHQIIAKSEPDGSVILLGSIGPLAIAPHMMKVGYDVQKDIAPLTMGLLFPNVLVVSPSLGVTSLAQYIALAKSKPGVLNYASTGAGSASHLAGELFNQEANIDILHIPYKGGAPALTDLLGGRVSAYFSTPSSAGPYIEAGKVIPLATTGLSRSTTLPSLPTVAESGFKGFNAVNWYAFVASAHMHPKILDRWNFEIVKVLQNPEVKEALIKHGLTPEPGTREELARFIDSESKKWGKLIRERKISAD